MRHKLVTPLLLFGVMGVAPAQNVITTFAGMDWVFKGDGGPAVNAPIAALGSVVIDPSGNPILVDSANCQVGRINTDGTFTVIAGNGLCVSDSGDGGLATNAGIPSVYSATYDPQGNLYLTTFGSFQHPNGGRIRKVSPNGIIRAFAGPGNPDIPTVFEPPPDGGQASQATILPSGVASDAAGNIYLVDEFTNSIRKIALDGTISTFAKSEAGLMKGLAFDRLGNLFVAYGNIVRKFTADGTISTVVADVASAWNLTVDSAGSVYIGGEAIVYKLAPGATKPIVIAGTGVDGFGGDGGPANRALLRSLAWVAVDKSGNLFIADSGNDRLRKVDLNGTITTIAGNGMYHDTGEGSPPLATAISDPRSLAIDGRDNLFFSERGRVRKAGRGSDGVVRITTVAGNGLYGSSGDSGPATQASLEPGAIAVDTTGNFYIADGERVRKVDPQGSISTVATFSAATGLVANGLALDRQGNLYVSGKDARVRKIDSRGNMTVFAGTGTAGYSGDGGAATSAQLKFPAGLAIDAAGNLYIGDETVVRMVNPGGIITTFAGTGISGNTGDDGPAIQASLGYPTSVAFDAENNVYIVDSYFFRIRKVDTTGRISAFAGGRPPSSQIIDGLPATAIGIFPAGIAVDRAGNLFLADKYTNIPGLGGYYDRIREVLAAPPSMQVSPPSLTLPIGASGGAPVAQTVAVTGSISGLRFTVAIEGDGPSKWLTAEALVGLTPRLLTLTADPGNLAPGTYTATVTIAPEAATPATLKVNVSFTVGPAQSPQIGIDHLALSFTLSQGTAPRTTPLKISNTGGQTLAYSGSVSTASGGNWLLISPGSGQVTPGKPSILSITANPAGLASGAYTGHVSIQSTGGDVTIPVIMTISSNPQAVLLSQTGLSFVAVERGGVIPPQSFGVINAGTGVMNWTASASVTTGGNWLTVSPAAGASDASAAAPQVTVAVNAAGLSAGKYYGTVHVDSPGTANLSRVVTIFLNVLQAGTAVSASVQPAELIFYAYADGGEPGSQILNLYNISAIPRMFDSARSSAGFTFDAFPSNGSLDPERPLKMVVQPYVSSNGTYTGSLLFQFSDGTIQSVKITLISAPGGATPQYDHAAGGQRRLDISACAPKQLVLALNSLSQSFQVSAGWPVGLSVKVQDDCQRPLVAGSGSVWAQFDNGEDDVPLTALGDGTWQGTWHPLSVSPSVTITVFAKNNSLPTAQKTISGALGSQNDQPYFTLSSVGSVFPAPAPAIRPLGPGSFLSIYGQRLADYSDDKGGPLPFSLANTQVFFNDRPAPISHADPGQLNVVVPNEINLHTSVQIRVQRGNTLSQPVAVDTADSQPTVLQTAGNAYVIDTPASGGSQFQVTPTSPAEAGDTLTMFCTGLGLTNPLVRDGATSPSSPLAQTPGVTVKIGGQDAGVAFAGLAPTYVGLYQINIVMPAGVTSGAAVPLTVTVAGQTSPQLNLAVR